MTEMLTASNTLNAASLYALEARLEKVNRKAAKLGVPAATYEADNYREVDIVDRDGHKTGDTKMVCDVVLTYADLRLPGGWRWCATIERGELGNLVFGPDAERFAHLREAKLTCDHCNHKRFRKLHYVVANDDGEEKVVGSTCLKDFLGESPSKILNFHTTMRDFLEDEDEWGYTSKPSTYRSLRAVVEYTLRQIELAGKYVKRDYYGYGDEPSTGECVKAAFFPSPHAKKEDIEHERPNDRNKEHANYVMARFEEVLAKVEKDITSASDFDYKIADATKAGCVDLDGKLFNVVVGSVGFHWTKIKRDLDNAANEKEAFGAEYVETIKNSGIKDRITVEGKVITVRECENNFGYYASSSTMIIVKCGHGDNSARVRFFTTKAPFDDWNEGDKVKLSVKVKRHNNDPKWGYSVDGNYPKVEK